MVTSSSGRPGCTCQNPSGATRELVPRHRVVDLARSGDQAVVDLDDVVRAVLAHPDPSAGQGDETRPGAPAQAVDVTGHRDHLEAATSSSSLSNPAEAHELLAHDGGLQLALRGQGDVLEVAAAAQSGSGEGHGGGTRSGDGVEHLDRVAAPEPVALGALGDLEDHPLPGQGVPDEDHRGSARRPAAGRRSDRRGRPDRPRPRTARRRASARGARSDAGRVRLIAATCFASRCTGSTRRAATQVAGLDPRSSRSSRSRASWEDRSW